MSVGIGLCINNTHAVLEALVGHPSELVRTPNQIGYLYTAILSLGQGLQARRGGI